ncbi:MAG: hypothetical protein HKP12_14165 [Gammaproteobacteria bacterium]|nr:hypothetical protein [Gammaproteobacteria bacterium]
MYILAEVIWWLLLVFGCSVAVLGIVLVFKSIPNKAIDGLSKANEEPVDSVEMAEEFGTLAEEKY